MSSPSEDEQPLEGEDLTWDYALHIDSRGLNTEKIRRGFSRTRRAVKGWKTRSKMQSDTPTVDLDPDTGVEVPDAEVLPHPDELESQVEPVPLRSKVMKKSTRQSARQMDEESRESDFNGFITFMETNLVRKIIIRKNNNITLNGHIVDALGFVFDYLPEGYFRGIRASQMPIAKARFDHLVKILYTDNRIDSEEVKEDIDQFQITYKLDYKDYLAHIEEHLVLFCRVVQWSLTYLNTVEMPVEDFTIHSLPVAQDGISNILFMLKEIERLDGQSLFLPMLTIPEQMVRPIKERGEAMHRLLNTTQGRKERGEAMYRLLNTTQGPPGLANPGVVFDSSTERKPTELERLGLGSEEKTGGVVSARRKRVIAFESRGSEEDLSEYNPDPGTQSFGATISHHLRKGPEIRVPRFDIRTELRDFFEEEPLSVPVTSDPENKVNLGTELRGLFEEEPPPVKIITDDHTLADNLRNLETNYIQAQREPERFLKVTQSSPIPPIGSLAQTQAVLPQETPFHFPLHRNYNPRTTHRTSHPSYSAPTPGDMPRSTVIRNPPGNGQGHISSQPQSRSGYAYGPPPLSSQEQSSRLGNEQNAFLDSLRDITRGNNEMNRGNNEVIRDLVATLSRLALSPRANPQTDRESNLGRVRLTMPVLLQDDTFSIEKFCTQIESILGGDLSSTGAKAVISQIHAKPSLVHCNNLRPFITNLTTLPEIFAELRKRASSSKVFEQKLKNRVVMGHYARSNQQILQNCQEIEVNLSYLEARSRGDSEMALWPLQEAEINHAMKQVYLESNLQLMLQEQVRMKAKVREENNGRLTALGYTREFEAHLRITKKNISAYQTCEEMFDYQSKGMNLSSARVGITGRDQSRDRSSSRGRNLSRSRDTSRDRSRSTSADRLRKPWLCPLNCGKVPFHLLFKCEKWPLIKNNSISLPEYVCQEHLGPKREDCKEDKCKGYKKSEWHSAICKLHKATRKHWALCTRCSKQDYERAMKEHDELNKPGSWQMRSNCNVTFSIAHFSDRDSQVMEFYEVININGKSVLILYDTGGSHTLFQDIPRENPNYEDWRQISKFDKKVWATIFTATGSNEGYRDRRTMNIGYASGNLPFTKESQTSARIHGLELEVPVSNKKKIIPPMVTKHYGDRMARNPTAEQLKNSMKILLGLDFEALHPIEIHPVPENIIKHYPGIKLVISRITNRVICYGNDSYTPSPMQKEVPSISRRNTSEELEDWEDESGIINIERKDTKAKPNLGPSLVANPRSTSTPVRCVSDPSRQSRMARLNVEPVQNIHDEDQNPTGAELCQDTAVEEDTEDIMESLSFLAQTADTTHLHLN